MLGPLVNAAVIFICALVGALFIRGMSARFEEIITKAIGLAVVFVGLRGALETERTLLLIMSLVVGAIAGEALNIDRGINRLGIWLETRLSRRGGGAAGAGNQKSFSKAFVSASILFCSGAMAIVGSMESGLQGKHDTLFAKSVLDGSISLVFGASLGIGTAFSAIPVLVYQGSIALAAMAVRDFLSPAMIREMSAAGSLIIAAIGFNFLAVKEIKVANLVPAVFVPLVWFTVEGLAA